LEIVEVSTKRREELIDVTPDVGQVIAGAGTKDGFCLVFSPHTTCGLTVNEGWDPDVARDVIRHLGKLVPRDGEWTHGEGNSDAHVKTILTGTSVLVPVLESRLQLGRWQKIFLCEFDGPRQRQLWLTTR
jgi:secondary thiamine-phosphate synthase enzyme